MIIIEFAYVFSQKVYTWLISACGLFPTGQYQTPPLAPAQARRRKDCAPAQARRRKDCAPAQARRRKDCAPAQARRRKDCDQAWFPNRRTFSTSSQNNFDNSKLKMVIHSTSCCFPFGARFPRAWLKPPRSLRYLRGLKAHAPAASLSVQENICYSRRSQHLHSKQQ